MATDTKKSVNTTHVWSITIEHQKCLWDNPEVPEVDIAFGNELDCYPCEQDAIEAVDRYLLTLGAVATWSDIRPIEQCSCCGGDVDTTTWHKCLTLTDEIRLLDDDGEIIEIQPIDGSYPARFCNSCVPPGEIPEWTGRAAK